RHMPSPISLMGVSAGRLSCTISTMSACAKRPAAAARSRRQARAEVVGMSTDQTDFLPRLSRGKHRSPRRGACFMEYASYLAGERWSDHPACTHPLLAELARQVNDHVSDDARRELVELVPDVIGVTGSDLRVDGRIALRAAQTALPIAPEEWQRV